MNALRVDGRCRRRRKASVCRGFRAVGGRRPKASSRYAISTAWRRGPAHAIRTLRPASADRRAARVRAVRQPQSVPVRSADREPRGSPCPAARSGANIRAGRPFLGMPGGSARSMIESTSVIQEVFRCPVPQHRRRRHRRPADGRRGARAERGRRARARPAGHGQTLSRRGQGAGRRVRQSTRPRSSATSWPTSQELLDAGVIESRRLGSDRTPPRSAAGPTGHDLHGRDAANVEREHPVLGDGRAHLPLQPGLLVLLQRHRASRASRSPRRNTSGSSRTCATSARSI